MRTWRGSVLARRGGVAATAASMLREEGAVALYRGLSVSLVKSAPATAITFAVYERALQWLGGDAAA